jgi:hypothetical protein
LRQTRCPADEAFRRGLIVVDGPTQQARDLTALLRALTMLGRKAARPRAIGIVTLLLTSRAGQSPRIPDAPERR